MKRSFILLDHSIEDATGHYLEYARRVLGAARQLGFRTVLGINKRAGEILCPEADVIDRAFTRTYWENQARSPTGLIADIAWGSSGIAGSDHFARQFAQESLGLARRVGARGGDLVFVPTLGGTELLGIALYSKLAEAEAFDWHLLFRRDLPSLRSILHGRAFIKLMRVKTAFAEFARQFERGRSFFYTDTEELSAQYQRLGAFRFSTLPIPIDNSLGVKKKNNGTSLIVSYLGDAREEKGFHLLPKLIRDIRAAGFGEDRVKFRIQANLPRTGGDTKSMRAKTELMDQQGMGLEILEGPFDSVHYNELISSSDVILIPYCAKSYRARSSGIFTEALAAGVPTIFPVDSWMGKSQQDSGSLGFSCVRDIASGLIEVLSRYSEYESHCQKFAGIWRRWHSATNLVDSLIKRIAHDRITHTGCNITIGSL